MLKNYERAVLDRIAAIHVIDPDTLSLGAKGAVFHRRGKELLCLCQRGSDYWNEIEAAIIAVDVIRQVARR